MFNQVSVLKTDARRSNHFAVRALQTNSKVVKYSTVTISLNFVLSLRALSKTFTFYIINAISAFSIKLIIFSCCFWLFCSWGAASPSPARWHKTKSHQLGADINLRALHLLLQDLVNPVCAAHLQGAGWRAAPACGRRKIKTTFEAAGRKKMRNVQRWVFCGGKSRPVLQSTLSLRQVAAYQMSVINGLRLSVRSWWPRGLGLVFIIGPSSHYTHVGAGEEHAPGTRVTDSQQYPFSCHKELFCRGTSECQRLLQYSIH